MPQTRPPIRFRHSKIAKSVILCFRRVLAADSPATPAPMMTTFFSSGSSKEDELASAMASGSFYDEHSTVPALGESRVLAC